MSIDLSKIIEYLPILFKGYQITLAIAVLSYGFSLILGFTLGFILHYTKPQSDIMNYRAKAIVLLTYVFFSLSYFNVYFNFLSYLIILYLLRDTFKNIFYVYLDFFAIFFRSIPFTVLLIFFFFSPSFILDYDISSFNVGVLSMSLVYSAYISEVVRYNITQIDTGSLDAAKSLGMSTPQIIYKIELPLCIRRVLSDLPLYAIFAVKDSSVLSIIGLREIFFEGRSLMMDNLDVINIWLGVSVIYLLTIYSITFIFRKIEHKMKNY